MDTNKDAANSTLVKPCSVLLDRNEVTTLMKQTPSKVLPVEPTSALLEESPCHSSKPTVIPPVCFYEVKYNDTVSDIAPKRMKLQAGVSNAKLLPTLKSSGILKRTDTPNNTTVISVFVTPKLRSDVECAILKLVSTRKIQIKKKCIRFSHENVMKSVSAILKAQTDNRKKKCRICDFNISDYHGLHEHYRHYHCLTFMCSNCGKDELSFYQFEEHLIEKHGLNKKVHKLTKALGAILAECEDIDIFFSCLFCTKTYSEKCMKLLFEYISKHKVHHVCKLCGLKFSSKQLLHTHIKNHSQSIVALVCNFCNLEFRRFKILQKHLETDCMISYTQSKTPFSNCFSSVKKIIPKPYIQPNCKYIDCPYCPTRFEESKTIFVFKHINIHKSEICTLCSESFVPQVYLNFTQEHEPVCEFCIIAENSKRFKLHPIFQIAPYKATNVFENISVPFASPEIPLSVSETSELRNIVSNSSETANITEDFSAPTTSCEKEISVPSSCVKSEFIGQHNSIPSDQGNQNFEISINIVWVKFCQSMRTFSKVLQASDLFKLIEEEVKRDTDNLTSYWCKYCRVNLLDYTSLYNHVKLSHQLYFSSNSSNVMNLSQLCSKMHLAFGIEYPMDSYMNLFGELIDAATNLKYSCLICHELFTLASIFDHVSMVHPYCRACCQPFETFKQLSMHILDHEAGKIKYYNCKMCSLDLKSLDKVKEHLDNEHKLDYSQIYYFSVETKLYFNSASYSYFEIPCPYCCVILHNKRKFMSHVKSHIHRKCVRCEKSYVAYIKSRFENAISHNCYLFSQILETDHMLETSGSSNLMGKYDVVRFHTNLIGISCVREIKQNDVTCLSCLYCNMYISCTDLYEHVIGEHQCCRICSLPFSDVEDWIKHRTQHEEGEILIFKCLYCSLELKSYKCLKEHFRYKGHDAMSLLNSSGYEKIPKYLLVGNEAKLFKCPYCCYDFDEDSSLTEHISKHAVLTCSACNSSIVPACEDIPDKSDFYCTRCILEDLTEPKPILEPILLEPEFVSVNQFQLDETSSIVPKTEIVTDDSALLLNSSEIDNGPSLFSTGTNDESSIITFDHFEIKSEVISEEEFLVN